MQGNSSIDTDKLDVTEREKYLQDHLAEGKRREALKRITVRTSESALKSEQKRIRRIFSRGLIKSWP